MNNNSYVVFHGTAKNPNSVLHCPLGVVFYIDDTFPKDDMRQLIADGMFTVREATIDEKEFCYWCMEKTNRNGADLDGFMFWQDWKKIKNK
jgi:hypothetical protein